MIFLSLLMTSVLIPISDIELEKIDYLVRMGKYKNRAQAIKALLKIGITHTYVTFEWEHIEEEEEEASRELLENMVKSAKPIITIQSSKSAHELISEDRAR
jgi:Arc/MetJ-type ribon-helix-helix transcriptional regulator